MNFRFKIAGLLLAVGGMILLQACGETTTTTTTGTPPFATPATTDRFWELVPPADPTLLAPETKYLYIRTQDTTDGKVRMFDPCTYKITGDAVKVGDTYEMTFGSEKVVAKFTGGKLEFDAKTTGNLMYTGTRRDLSYTCNAEKKPTDLKAYTGTDSGVFAITCSAEQIGCKHMQAAASQLLPDSNLVAAQIQAQFKASGATPPPNTSTPVTTPEGVQTLVCASDVSAKTDQASRDEMTLMASDPYIFPGSIIRGNFFAAGQTSPVTALRSGGTVTLTSLVLNSGAQYSKSVDVVDQASIQGAIQSLVNDNQIVGRVAIGNSVITSVDSTSSLQFSMGLDVRFPQGSVATQFSLNTSSSENSVMMKVTQIYYFIDFADPVGPFDLFKDGINLSDPSDQIGVKTAVISTGQAAPMDPPLYVKRVGYGRQIVVVAKSSASSSDLKAALQGSYKTAGGIEIDANSKTAYATTLKNTEVSVFVYGGSAADGFKVLGAKGTEDMFDRVRTLLTDGAAVSPSNPGAPVTFRLNYVTNQTPAAMGYAATYYNRDCKQVPPSFSAYSVYIDSINGNWKINVDKGDGAGLQTVLGPNRDPGAINLVSPTYIPADINDHTLEVEIDNRGCGYTTSSFRVARYKDTPTGPDTKVLYYRLDPGIMTFCNIAIGKYKFIINRGDGKLDASTVCESNSGC